MEDELPSLRSQLKDHRQRLRELNRQCRLVHLRTCNYDAIAETRRSLSEQIMVGDNLRDSHRRERERAAAARVERVEAEVAELERLVRETPPPETVATPADQERLAEVRGRADHLAGAIASLRTELDSEILREQREVQKILAELDVEQRALEACQKVCDELEAELAHARTPPPLPGAKRVPPPPPPPREEA